MGVPYSTMVVVVFVPTANQGHFLNLEEGIPQYVF
jgi:hypothetical protein